MLFRSQADIVLVMELAHLDRLLQHHPSARGKAFLLAAASATGRTDTEVADPWGQPRTTYERVARQVAVAVDGWLGASAADQRSAAAPASAQPGVTPGTWHSAP